MSTYSILPTLFFSGEQLFRVLESEPLRGMPAHSTVTVRYHPAPQADACWNENGHSGPGLYACFWDGRLFYVGTYAGNGPNPQIGNVAKERWSKHVAGMTFRGRRLSISSRWLGKILEDHTGPLVDLLASADTTILTRDKGLQTQFNKFRFAQHHWDDFATLDNGMLTRFSFIYLRPQLTNGFAGAAKRDLDPHLRRIEHQIIEALDPPCKASRWESILQVRQSRRLTARCDPSCGNISRP